MKKFVLFLLCLGVMANSLMSISFTFAQTPQQESLERLSELLKNANAPDATLSDEERKELETLILIVFPDENYIGTDKVWRITYHDEKEGRDFFAVDLTKKEDQRQKYIWFHILYKTKKPSSFGSGEEFKGYPVMHMKDQHYFVLVGNVEIRAVAHAEEYHNDDKIKEVLSAFKLEEIEKL